MEIGWDFDGTWFCWLIWDMIGVEIFSGFDIPTIFSLLTFHDIPVDGEYHILSALSTPFKFLHQHSAAILMGYVPSEFSDFVDATGLIIVAIYST